MTDYVVAQADDLGEGEQLVVEIEGRDIGVFNVGGELYAYTSWCPHQGGPVCEGKLDATTTAAWDPETLEVHVEWIKEGEILICPWHGWEFDIATGESRSKDKVRLPSHDVRVENGEIVVSF